MQRLIFWRHRQRNGLKYLYFGCILLFLSTTLPAAAQRLEMLPSLKVTGGYNDNILFNRTQPVDDVYTSARPEINLGLASGRYDLRLDSYAEIFRFLDKKDLDYENYRYDMDGGYRLTQRLNISGNFQYLKDTTLDSEVEESGRVVARGDRERYQGGGALSYDLNEVSGIDLAYRYRSTEYESRDRIDRIASRVELSYQRWFNNRLDQLTLQPSYEIAETENSRDIEYYRFSVGWRHIFSDTLTMRNFVGYGQTVSTENGDQALSRSGNADLSLTETGEIYSFRIGIRSNINLNTEGELEQVDRLYCRMKKKMTERLSVKLDASVYVTRAPEIYDTIDSVYYDIKPELSYAITEKHLLNVFYQYSYQEDQTVSENQDSVRNVIELNLIFQFPWQT